MRVISFLLLSGIVFGQTTYGQSVPTPKSHFGFNIGDDYSLANYTQTVAYFQKIAAVSDRVKLVNTGMTEEGRNQYMMIISSPANMARLEEYRQISMRLGRAGGLGEAEARALAASGKAVVWIDGGIHANETETAQQLIETIYQLASRNDSETLHILDNVIVLCAHANPDGQELVANWYMQNPVPEKRKVYGFQKLYVKYAEHDDNRDYYVQNLKETRNLSRQLYIEWLPQIMYNHHQAPGGEAVVSGPPYGDPFNYVFDPLVITGVDELGAAMITRLCVENKPGYVRGSDGGGFSTWYNGGLRTMTYYHNIIGLLTEINGSPTPEDISLETDGMLPNMSNPFPIRPGHWHFRQTIDYSVSLNYAVLSYAARHRDELLYNIYRMGRNSIERGSRDYWTITPKKVAMVDELYKALYRMRDSVRKKFGNFEQHVYDSVMTDPKLRDPRGYLIPADQPDFPNAVAFLNALIRTGVVVERATAAFSVGGKAYPAGSYVVKTAQAFRPHVLDMFEPQDYPMLSEYRGGPPKHPYDQAGWTLAYQMGVKFDRMMDGFDGPFETMPYGQVLAPPGRALGSHGKVAGYMLNTACNNAYKAVNELLANGITVYRIMDSVKGATVAKGSFFVHASSSAAAALEKARVDLGVDVYSVAKAPKTLGKRLEPLRVGVVDAYGGSVSSGWCQYILDTFHFPYRLVYMNQIDSGNLRSKFDVILCMNGSEDGQTPKDSLAQPFKYMFGQYSEAKSLPALKAFVEQGGSLVLTGNSAELYAAFRLPVRNALVADWVDGYQQGLSQNKFFIPGSILKVQVNTGLPVAAGMDTVADLPYRNNTTFLLNPLAVDRVKPILWFGTDDPLRSGWEIGGQYLQYGISAFECSLGRGKVYVYGTDLNFRAQPSGLYKLLFNTLYSDGLE